MTVKLITFDLDDTLWEVAPTIRRAEQLLDDWLGEHAATYGRITVEHRAAVRGQLLAADASLKHRISELRRQALTQVLQEVGYAPEFAQTLALQAFEVFLQARHDVTLFEQVPHVLQALGEQYDLGVITNGNADVQRLGLAHYFKFALCAEDLGIGKPDPAPFTAALRLGGVSASEAVHVGDHPNDDIAGAQRAGMRAIWFNPKGLAWPEANGADVGRPNAGRPNVGRPEAEIRDLSELPDLLKSW